jgi:hypothetical protein
VLEFVVKALIDVILSLIGAGILVLFGAVAWVAFGICFVVIGILLIPYRPNGDWIH